eukprot:Seg14778.1 transcript_id=Seg14778.1/GoldUCD/mRNA.D3Y31 product="hypothetical protein" protein_id=Seg14778.1/GoldUCD/D3Y31
MSASDEAQLEAEDRIKSLREWRRTAKAVLKIRCAKYGLATSGPKNTLAERIFSHFNEPQHREGSSIMVDTPFVITEVNHEHETQQGAAQKSSSSTVNREIVGF